LINPKVEPWHENGGASPPFSVSPLSFSIQFPMKTILAPLDLKTDTTKVLDQAVEIARARNAKLWILHVAAPDPDFVGYEAGPQYIRDVRAGILRDEHGQLERIVARLTSDGVDCQQLLIMGATVETILGEAARLGADLIVMGTHGRRGLAKAFMGSTCDEVLRANRFPVLVVPTPVP
jgi:nucleotide-binding universal stress UspA family protein